MKNIDKELGNLSNLDMKNIKRRVTQVAKTINFDYKKEQEKLVKFYKSRLAKLDEFGKTIEKYSTFYIKDMGPIIADLFTLYNGEIYEYDFDHNCLDIYNCYIIVPSNKRKKVNLISFIGEKFIDPGCKKITYYEYSDYYRTFFSDNLIKYYPYLKLFINYVIEYRFNNKIENIDNHHLEKCLHDFVVLHKEEIEEIQNKVKEEQKGEYDATLKLALAKPYLDRKAEMK